MVADRAGVAFLGLWLEAPVEVMRQRMTDRQGDASDATEAVVLAQAREDIGMVSWHRLDASQPLNALRVAALTLVPCPEFQTPG